MKRRDLFKLAVPAAAVAVIPRLNANALPISSQDAQSEMELYRGFRITWRGWFHANNQDESEESGEAMSEVCTLILSKYVLPGWGCCQCHTYNGLQRKACKHCRHKPCIELPKPEQFGLCNECGVPAGIPHDHQL